MNKKKQNANKGATIIEYALIAGLIAVVAITAMNNIGSSVQSKFSAVASTLSSAGTSV